MFSGTFNSGCRPPMLPQPRHQVVIEMLVALGADVNGLAEAEGVHGDGGLAGVKILGIGRQYLAALRLDQIAPEFGRMQMAGRERAFEREMVFLARRQRVEFLHLQAEQVGEIVRKAGIRRDAVLVHQAGVERADERAAILHVKFQAVGVAGGKQMQRRREDDFVSRQILVRAARNPRGCCGRAARCR